MLNSLLHLTHVPQCHRIVCRSFGRTTPVEFIPPNERPTRMPDARRSPSIPSLAGTVYTRFPCRLRATRAPLTASASSRRTAPVQRLQPLPTPSPRRGGQLGDGVAVVGAHDLAPVHARGVRASIAAKNGLRDLLGLTLARHLAPPSRIPCGSLPASTARPLCAPCKSQRQDRGRSCPGRCTRSAR